MLAKNGATVTDPRDCLIQVRGCGVLVQVMMVASHKKQGSPHVVGAMGCPPASKAHDVANTQEGDGRSTDSADREHPQMACLDVQRGRQLVEDDQLNTVHLIIINSNTTIVTKKAKIHPYIESLSKTMDAGPLKRIYHCQVQL